MTWSFDATDMTTDLNRVRSLLGDVNTNDQLLTDEQIAFKLTEYPDYRTAAAECCVDIRAKLARDVDRSNQGISASRSQQMNHYRDLEVTLRARAMATGGAVVTTGFSSISDKADITSDSDKVQPFSGRDKFNNPSAGASAATGSDD